MSIPILWNTHFYSYLTFSKGRGRVFCLLRPPTPHCFPVLCRLQNMLADQQRRAAEAGGSAP